MDLQTLRRKALNRYGIVNYGAEDSLFPYSLLTDLINEAHRWLIRETKALQETKTAIVTASQQYVSLAADVYEFDPDTVLILVDGAWRRLAPVTKQWLVHSFGPLEEMDAGDPSYYWSETAAVADAHRRLYLSPTPRTTVVNGLKYDAWVYPPELADETDTPVLPGAEHDALLPAICWRMALTEQGRGRQDAPVGSWLQLAKEAKDHLRSTLQQMREPGPRRVRTDGWDTYDY